MNSMEENIMHSFKRAKSDIIQLQNDFLSLSKTQTRIIEMLSKLDTQEVSLCNKMKELDAKISAQPNMAGGTARKSKTFVATKTGKNFHIPNCPYAQNIKRNNKVSFKSKIKALSSGYKPCKCTK